MGLFGAQTVVAGAMGVLVVVTALRLLNLGTAGVGWLYAATGVGGIIGAGVTMVLVGRKRLAGDFGVGLLLWGIPFLVMGVWPNAIVALLMLGVLGIGNTLVDVSGRRCCSETRRTRCARVSSASSRAWSRDDRPRCDPRAAPDRSLRNPRRARRDGPVPADPGRAALARLVSLDAGDPAHLDLLRRLPIFAPLPPQALERLARSLQPVHLAAGAVLFQAGDEGDRFYVIESGELAVDPRERGLKTEGPGAGSGDRAPAWTCRARATVRAVTDADLLALDRDEFSGQSPATRPRTPPRTRSSASASRSRRSSRDRLLDQAVGAVPDPALRGRAQVVDRHVVGRESLRVDHRAVDALRREAEVEEALVELERTGVADARVPVADEEVEVRRRRNQLEVRRRLHLRVDLARDRTRARAAASGTRPPRRRAARRASGRRARAAPSGGRGRRARGRRRRRCCRVRRGRAAAVLVARVDHVVAALGEVRLPRLQLLARVRRARAAGRRPPSASPSRARPSTAPCRRRSTRTSRARFRRTQPSNGRAEQNANRPARPAPRRPRHDHLPRRGRL